MVANRTDPPARPGGEPAKGAPAPEPAPKTPEAAPASASGLKPWLPLLVAIVLMPVLAYAMTTFVLAPKLAHAVGNAPAKPGEHASEKAAKSHAAEGGSKEGRKTNVPLKQVLVNVAGTQGMRFLMASLTLVGTEENFKAKIDEKQAQLADIASSTLCSKTISDLEKPGSRNMIRTELISSFNNVLGNDCVQELYFTEFAVQ